MRIEKLPLSKMTDEQVRCAFMTTHKHDFESIFALDGTKFEKVLHMRCKKCGYKIEHIQPMYEEYL